MTQDTSQASQPKSTQVSQDNNWAYRWINDQWRCGRCGKPLYASDTTDKEAICKCNTAKQHWNLASMHDMSIQSQAWECPVCHNVYAYWVAQCWECKERIARERVASTNKERVVEDMGSGWKIVDENTALRESKNTMERMIDQWEDMARLLITLWDQSDEDGRPYEFRDVMSNIRDLLKGGKVTWTTRATRMEHLVMRALQIISCDFPEGGDGDKEDSHRGWLAEAREEM